MRALLPGEPVAVLRRAETGRDELNNAVLEWAEEEVAGVLCAPQSATDAASATRPDGDESEAAFYFPASYAAPLRGCRIRWAGKVFEVQGDPLPYRADMVPGSWNREVRAVLKEG